MPSRRCWVEVDGRALRHNINVVRGLIPKTTQLLAVIKANAYGHGLVPVAQEFARLGTDWLGVANVAEGFTLRKAGIRLPILLLSAALPNEMEDAIKHALTLTVSSREEAVPLDRLALKMRRKAGVHFKVDTGMGRLGCWYPDAEGELARLRMLKNVTVTGLCTHFASADDNARLTTAQWNRMTPFFERYPDLLRHAANSPAVTRGYGFHAGMVRAGLALYGVIPNLADRKLNLQPALTWKSRIALLREVGAGRTVSYGATYRLRSRQKHAIVGMGYGDGYFRLHSDGGHFLVRGMRCPIRGRVTMDQIVIDVSKLPDVRIGDEVVALGSQGKGEITAHELAREAQTIPWEILTNIGARVPRVYHHFQTAT